MAILLLGASGFLGNEIGRALIGDGYSVRAAGRDIAYGRRALPGAEWRFCDLRRMSSARDWEHILASVDMVVNASGAVQSGLRHDVDKVQEHESRSHTDTVGQG